MDDTRALVGVGNSVKRSNATQRNATRNGFVPVKDPMIQGVFGIFNACEVEGSKRVGRVFQTRNGHKHSTVSYYCLKSRLTDLYSPQTRQYFNFGCLRLNSETPGAK
jgi:hypothetical protein